MRKKKAYTLVELLVTMAIVGIFVALLFPACCALVGNNAVEFNGRVVEKWVDMDFDGNRIYRAKIEMPNGELMVYDSYFCHNDINIDQKYTFYDNRLSTYLTVKK